MLRDAVANSLASLQEAKEVKAHPGNAGGINQAKRAALSPGPCYPLDADWGARVACFGLLVAGLRNAERLISAASRLRHADPNEAAWWLGLLTQENNLRALRALRILTEAVE